ncbi:hypothetical protein BDY17DRAFT_300154 [Neohortaea acidophila]|uniref:Apple domain-containing protein n=1 Tax=Neohortaea acidophila TaxID=245834 RepID=A0A6A6PPK5_9PEZI|nr:uncharacterized protein BDY17DRAFT_300154 [Neohortaea acidophila]KAF2482040.1 hypothetical protein BDY17DRAFT_300154 [Neohortaea acidophila]
MLSSHLTLLLCVASTSAHWLRGKGDIFCHEVTGAVAAFHAQSPASSFCSSYLHVPGPTTVTHQTHTYSTLKTIISYAATITSTASTTSTVTVSPTCTGAGVAGRRAKRSVSKPQVLAQWTASAILSSACSCLSITRSTVVVGAATTSTSTTVVSSTATVTSTPITTVLIPPSGFKLYATTTPPPDPQTFTYSTSIVYTVSFSAQGSYLAPVRNAEFTETEAGAATCSLIGTALNCGGENFTTIPADYDLPALNQEVGRQISCELFTTPNDQCALNCLNYAGGTPLNQICDSDGPYLWTIPGSESSCVTFAPVVQEV